MLQVTFILSLSVISKHTFFKKNQDSDSKDKRELYKLLIPSF